ncbi:MAG: cell division protein FtsX [Lysobacterales bacterium RIFOXYD1_FULL_69_11]|nr:MAG: cell division protein FtsX [Xanthomonadales bacterium RIFOXYA1_FULL_69_10]OHE87151.1 MAG: cell division protein FtsX [Xanthomonadales bacterium RIFOXYD1_FULL_69_11]
MTAPTTHTVTPRSRSRIGAWLDHHAYSFVASIGRMLGKPWATLLTVGVMAVALALPLGLWGALSNVERLAGDVRQSRQVSVFLQPSVDGGQAAALADTLRGDADVAAVELRTPDQGLAELHERGGLGEAVDALDSLGLDENPLPYLLLVTPSGDERLLADRLQSLPQADVIQHDAAWRERLDGWLRFGLRLAAVLAVLLGLGAALVVGNTVRLDIQQRREEIGVLQLLGATDGFIRRPFLYLGAWYGLAAGALALLVLTGTQLALSAPLAELAASYGSDFALRGFAPLHVLAIVLAAAALGWLGAGLVTGHYLRQTRPTDT